MFGKLGVYESGDERIRGVRQKPFSRTLINPEIKGEVEQVDFITPSFAGEGLGASSQMTSDQAYRIAASKTHSITSCLVAIHRVIVPIINSLPAGSKRTALLALNTEKDSIAKALDAIKKQHDTLSAKIARIQIFSWLRGTETDTGLTLLSRVNALEQQSVALAKKVAKYGYSVPTCGVTSSAAPVIKDDALTKGLDKGLNLLYAALGVGAIYAVVRYGPDLFKAVKSK